MICKKNIFFICLVFIGLISFSQNSKDVVRLSKLKYMEELRGISCDSLREISIIGRYCLNKDLQEIDSIMFIKFNESKKSLDKNQQMKLVKNQKLWERHRVSFAEMKSEGLEGNALGAYYLHAMIIATKSRLKELELLLEP